MTTMLEPELLTHTCNGVPGSTGSFLAPVTKSVHCLLITKSRALRLEYRAWRPWYGEALVDVISRRAVARRTRQKTWKFIFRFEQEKF